MLYYQLIAKELREEAGVKVADVYRGTAENRG
jgi:hypothetical protein